MILAYNDIIGTNFINLNNNFKKAEKKVKKKHTSYDDTIFKIIKRNPHYYIMDNYINKSSSINLQTIIPLIKSLKNEEIIRNKLIKLMSYNSKDSFYKNKKYKINKKKI